MIALVHVYVAGDGYEIASSTQRALHFADQEWFSVADARICDNTNLLVVGATNG